MKLRHLSIGRYKNLHDCVVEFDKPQLISAIIGNNGSGKSNLIEAILLILINVYFKKSPPFDFSFEYEAQHRVVRLRGENRRVTVQIDGQPFPMDRFAERLREGSSQVFYPELTFVYYSGECPRVQNLISRYQRHFRKLTRKPDTDRLRPLFVQSSNEQSRVILFALFAHGHATFLEQLGLRGIENVRLVLRSPKGFDPLRDEPKLWNTQGAVRRVIAAIDDTASLQESNRVEGRIREVLPWEDEPDEPDYKEIRRYYFEPDHVSNVWKLAQRLSASGDNVYSAFESLNARGIFESIEFRLKGTDSDETFSFEQLSEGEKQLIAVVGAIRLTNKSDNFVLLDEPDTHLNPHWSWEYPSMLADAFEVDQRESSTVLMATHDPIMISGMTRDQVFLANAHAIEGLAFSHPYRNPRGQGIANILCSSEFFGLPSSLDKETQKLMDERMAIIVKPELTDREKARLRKLNEELEILVPGVSERDPEYASYLRDKQSKNLA